MTLKDITKDRILYDGYTNFEQTPCSFILPSSFTEDAVTYVYSDSLIADPVKGDSIKFMWTTNKETRQRNGSYTSGDMTQPGYCYTMSLRPPAFGTLGFSYDYSMIHIKYPRILSRTNHQNQENMLHQ